LLQDQDYISPKRQNVMELHTFYYTTCNLL